MIKLEVDDSQIKEFFKKSPARAEWSMKEALSMAGGHYRKILREYIEKGGEGWPPLKPITQAGKVTGRKHLIKTGGKTPLYGMGKAVRFKVGKVKGVVSASVGFLAKGLPKIARVHETGKRIRVTPELRGRFAAFGFPLRSTTKWLQIPKRPMIEWLWERHISKDSGNYIEKRFFEQFFSKKNPVGY